MSRDHLTCPTIDFVFMQDLSGSYTDDLPILKSQIANVIATVSGISQNAWFGVSSFIDKPTSSFGQPGEWVYRTDLALTGNGASVVSTINGLSTRNGLDEPEAQIEALMQVALRQAEVGYRDGTMRIVMLSTDSSFHQAGDFPGVPANNGDVILDGGGIGEDYPAIAQVAAALAAAGVFPVFSVTAAQKARYESLVADLGTGAVVILSSDSSDFADAVRLAIAKACGHVTHEGTELDDSIDGTELDDGIFGIGGDDDLDGHDGHDLVDGGSGNDRLRGGKGQDDLYGGTGNDELRGGSGGDLLSGGLGNDLLIGNKGADVFVLNPGDGNDTVGDFQDGADLVDLSSFHRHEGVSAVASAVQAGADVVLTLPGGTTLTLRSFTLADFGLDDVILNPDGDPPVAMDDSAALIAGGKVFVDVLANDSDIDNDPLTVTAVGAAANGTLSIMASGKIRYTPDAGFFGNDSFDYTISDGTFTDTATVTVTVSPNPIGGPGDDVLTGTTGDDLMKGFGGNDTIDGREGLDTIRGGDGADSILGGIGNDDIKGGKGADIIIGGPVFTGDLPDKDTIDGGGGADDIRGGWGDDLIHGGKGNDLIDGEVGDDKLHGDAGNDTLYGGADNDEIFGGDGDDLIDGGSGNDQLRDGAGADTIIGGTGDDEIIISGTGTGDNDLLSSGTGADLFIFKLGFGATRGNDTVTDFDIAADLVKLDGDVLVSLTDTAAGALVEQATGGSILFENVLVADLRPLIEGLVEI